MKLSREAIAVLKHHQRLFGWAGPRSNTNAATQAYATLVKHRLMERDNVGLYRLTDAGREALTLIRSE